MNESILFTCVFALPLLLWAVPEGTGDRGQPGGAIEETVTFTMEDWDSGRFRYQFFREGKREEGEVIDGIQTIHRVILDNSGVMICQNAKAEVAAEPMTVRRIPVELQARVFADRLDMFDLAVAAHAPCPVTAYMAMPKNAKPKLLPVCIFYGGAGVLSSWPQPNWAAVGDADALFACGYRDMIWGQESVYAAYNDLATGSKEMVDDYTGDHELSSKRVMKGGKSSSGSFEKLRR